MATDELTSFFETLPFVVVGLKLETLPAGQTVLVIDSANAVARAQNDVLAQPGETALAFVERIAGASAADLMTAIARVQREGGLVLHDVLHGTEIKRRITVRQRPHQLNLVDLIFQDTLPSESVRESVLEKVLSSIPHSVFWKDRNSVYLGCNEQFMRNANLTSRDQIVGKTDFDLPWSTTNAEDYRRYDAEMMASGKAIMSIEETQLQSDGSLIHVVTSKAPLVDEQNQVIGVLGIYVDITELRQAQSRVEEQQKKIASISKMASLGEMASGIAHEINNPLAIITVLTNEIRDEYETLGVSAPPAVLEHLEMIQQTTGRIGEIIKGLRSFSRNETGTAKVGAPAQELLDSTLRFCADKLRAQNVELRKASIPQDEKIWCRPTEISQVIINIVNNACDAIAEQQLAERWIAVDVKSVDQGHVIEITDSGLGVPEALRDKIFEPFFTTKKIGKGTGLGLSISAGLVKAHGGNLSYHCDDHGSRFVIVLPNELSNELNDLQSFAPLAQIGA